VQDLLPVSASVSGVSASNVAVTIIIFFGLFTALLIAELKIMFSQIRKGPQDEA
jgi:cytochrome d ubiquinol oxidase subunit I